MYSCFLTEQQWKREVVLCISCSTGLWASDCGGLEPVRAGTVPRLQPVYQSQQPVISPDSSGTCAGASACVRQCVFTLARRAITAGRVNLTDPILPHSLLCTLIASVQLLMDFITCNDTWPADLSQCSVVVPTVRVDSFAEGSRSGGSWGGWSTFQRGGGGRIQKQRTYFYKHLSFHFGVFIQHNTFCNIFDRMVINVFKLNILSNAMHWTPSLFGSRIYIRLLKN